MKSGLNYFAKEKDEKGNQHNLNGLFRDRENTLLFFKLCSQFIYIFGNDDEKLKVVVDGKICIHRL